MEINVVCTMKLKGIQSFKNMLHKDDRGPMSPIITKVMQQWAVRYRSFIQERFDKFSKGGGDWKPLAESTIQSRLKRAASALRHSLALGEITDTQFAKRIKAAKAKDARSQSKFEKEGGYKQYKKDYKAGEDTNFPILRDTNVLFESLDPTFKGQPGAIENWVPYGIQVGFGGNATHSGSELTIAEIAMFHQKGGPNLPQRKIIVKPSDEVIRQMQEDVKRAMLDYYREHAKENDSGSSPSSFDVSSVIQLVII